MNQHGIAVKDARFANTATRSVSELSSFRLSDMPDFPLRVLRQLAAGINCKSRHSWYKV